MNESRLKKLEKALAQCRAGAEASQHIVLTLEQRLLGQQNILKRLGIPDPFPDLVGEEKVVRTSKWIIEQGQRERAAKGLPPWQPPPTPAGD
jgi:hypothetical protein